MIVDFYHFHQNKLVHIQPYIRGIKIKLLLKLRDKTDALGYVTLAITLFIYAIILLCPLTEQPNTHTCLLL